MTFAHFLDPPVQMAAAERFGRLVALGVVTRKEALAALWQAARRHYAENPPPIKPDPIGLRLRLGWAVDDACSHWRLQRTLAEAEVGRAVREAIARKAPSAEVADAAAAANAKRDCAMTEPEIEALLTAAFRDAIERAEGRARRTGRGRFGSPGRLRHG